MSTGLQVTFDAGDPHAQARFWAEALGYRVEDHSGFIGQLRAAGQVTDADVIELDGRAAFREVAACRDPDGTGPRLYFQRVAEPKVAKNRVHLDLNIGPERREAEVARLVGLGAEVLWETSDRGPVTTTLADPEGNELCVH